jgi:hypothetical protein
MWYLHQRVYLLRDDFRDTEDLDGLFSGGMQREKKETRAGRIVRAGTAGESPAT